MAATNYTPIQLYHSTTASAVPVNTNLVNGELAINITDGKLYYKDNGGTVQVIASKGTGTIGGSTTQVQYNLSGALAGSSNFTFNGTTATINTLNLTNALGATYGGTAQSSWTTGDLLYASGSNTLAKLGIGLNTYILTSNGSIPGWAAPSAISVNTATNLAGGAAGSVPYQSGAGATTFLSIGTANQVVTSTGSAPQWSSGLSITTLTASDAVTFSATTQNIALGTSQTSGTFTVGGTAQTGNIAIDRSTKTHTLNIGTGITESGQTKTINIGTAGDTGSTTAITIGSANGTTITVNGTVNASTLDLTNLEVTNIKAKDGTASMTLADTTGIITLSATAGTANGVLYLNGSRAVTSGSALTFDGTNLDLATVGAKVNFATTSSATRNYVGGAADGFSLEMVTQRGASQPLSYKQNYAVGHEWGIAGSIPMTLDASGNLAIGTTSIFTNPRLSVYNGATLTTGGDGGGNGVLIAAATGAASSGQLVVAGSDTAAIDKGGAIVFAGKWDTATNNIAQWAKIVGYKENATNNNYAGYLGFYTRADGGAATERARIDSSGTLILRQSSNAANTSVSFNTTVQNALTLDSSGNLLVGTTSTSLENSRSFEWIGSSGGVFRVNHSTSNGSGDPYFQFGYNASQIGAISQSGTTALSVGSANELVLCAGGVTTERARITSIGGFETRPAASGHAVFNEDGVDADFRVESDLNTHMLFVDGGNDAVGIGMVPLTTFGNRNSLEIGGNTVANLSLQAAIAETLYNFYINGSGQSVYSTDGPAGFQAFNNAVSAGWSFQTYPSGTAGGLTPAGTDLLALSPNGTIFNEGGADIDFRVESDTNTHALFVDAGNNQVFIGAASGISTAPLNVVRFGTANTINKILSLYDSNFFPSGFPTLELAGWQGGGNINRAYMSYEPGSRLVFYTAPNAAGDPTPLERAAFGNSETVFNEQSYDVDFRVESDTDTHCLFVDASTNRVGIGTNAPGEKLEVQGGFIATYDATNALGAGYSIRFYSNGGTAGAKAEMARVGGVQETGASSNNGALIFATRVSGTVDERARITSLGYFKASNTGSYVGLTGGYHELVNDISDYIAQARNSHSSNAYGIRIQYSGSAPNGTGNEFLYCDDNASGGTLRAAIRSNGGLANYSANNVNLASDERLKKDISPLATTWDKLKQIEVVNFRYKDCNEGDPLLYGVIAQQVQPIVPELVVVTREAKEAVEAKDAVLDENGKVIEPAVEAKEATPDYYGIREQPMYWLAIKALQEAMARIEKLEAEVAALKGA